jgi:uncharacterized protein YndB with AHSA1/START domain
VKSRETNSPSTAASPAADAAAAAAATPIVLETNVPCPPERAFVYFTRDIGRWWPLATYSCGGDAAQDVRFEPRVGGGLLETTRDGTTHRWGTVSAWAPGKRVAFSWHPGRDDSAAQWVEVAFVGNAAGTRVTLTHGGFERLGARARAVKSEYENGWPTVFGRLYPAHCTEAEKEVRP